MFLHLRGIDREVSIVIKSVQNRNVNRYSEGLWYQADQLWCICTVGLGSILKLVAPQKAKGEVMGRMTTKFYPFSEALTLDSTSLPLPLSVDTFHDLAVLDGNIGVVVNDGSTYAVLSIASVRARSHRLLVVCLFSTGVCVVRLSV